MNNEKIDLDLLPKISEIESRSKNEGKSIIWSPKIESPSKNDGKTVTWNEALEYNKNETTTPDSKTQTGLAQEAQANAEYVNAQPEKTVEDLKNDILYYREQIKIGETKGAGGYNEKLVLENEAKLREAEKMINDKMEESNKQNKIDEIRKEIAGYREQIKIGETKGAGGYNEKLVLENEAKLREAENKINQIKNPVQINTENQINANEDSQTNAPKKKRSWLMRKLFGNKE